MVYGGDLGYRHSGHFFDMDAVATVGVQARIDAIHARLGPQVKRAPLGTTVDSNIDEASYAPLPQIGTAADSMAATGGRCPHGAVYLRRAKPL